MILVINGRAYALAEAGLGSGQEDEQRDSKGMVTVEDKVVLKGVRKSFRVDGRVTMALDGIDMVARDMEFVTLIGPSGCGKSTLFNIICGLMEPEEGQVWLNSSVDGLRIGTVGYMPQKDLLLPWRSVLDNIILGPELAGVDRRKARREARELLPLFGLAGFEDSYPVTLSGGMKQRAALLRTVSCHRDIMLLDEPFGALDALTRSTLQDWLLGIWQRFRQTILFITHDVEEAVYLSDRVYVMSARPARMMKELTVPLARPRCRDMVATESFVSCKVELLAALGT